MPWGMGGAINPAQGGENRRGVQMVRRGDYPLTP